MYKKHQKDSKKVGIGKNREATCDSSCNQKKRGEEDEHGAISEPTEPVGYTL